MKRPAQTTYPLQAKRQKTPYGLEYSQDYHQPDNRQQYFHPKAPQPTNQPRPLGFLPQAGVQTNPQPQPRQVTNEGGGAFIDPRQGQPQPRVLPRILQAGIQTDPQHRTFKNQQTNTFVNPQAHQPQPYPQQYTTHYQAPPRKPVPPQPQPQSQARPVAIPPRQQDIYELNHSLLANPHGESMRANQQGVWLQRSKFWHGMDSSLYRPVKVSIKYFTPQVLSL